MEPFMWDGGVEAAPTPSHGLFSSLGTFVSLSRRENIWNGTSPIDPVLQPFALFLVQILIILLMARLLSVGLQFIRQPKVIAEVIGGILLGPSVFGRIPGFTATIFPPISLPALSAVANLGLCFYLFLVGLELDPAVLKRNASRALATSIAGMVVPFALGAASSWALYEKFMDVPGATNVPPFGSFLLFLGVAMSITAFPVLARILTERKLYPTTVGIATISAAAVDDAAAWCLLALVVSIVNSTNLLYALYTFLCAVAWTVIILFGLRPLLHRLVVWAERRGRSGAVSEALVFTMFALVMISSFVTEMIGVHAIFGAFLMGIATPHTNGFALRLTAKIEDMITMIFIPIYFTLSGLKTNIGLLDDGIAWAFVVMVVAVACAGKMLGCTFAARFSGLQWREAWAVGILMNTKGLVELIVLNVGLNAGVINTKVFTIMVMMALVTTFMTTPLISFVYPAKYYTYAQGVDLARLGIHVKEDDLAHNGTGPDHRHEESSTAVELPHRTTDKANSFDGGRSIKEIIAVPGATSSVNTNLLVCLREPNTLPGAMALSSMLSKASAPIITALRLTEMDDRLSSVSVAANFSSTEVMIGRDAVLSIFRTFGTLNGMIVEPQLGFVENDDWSGEIVTRAMQKQAGLVVLPWDLDDASSQGLAGSSEMELAQAVGASGLLLESTTAAAQQTPGSSSQVGVVSTGRFDYFFDAAAGNNASAATPVKRASYTNGTTPGASGPVAVVAPPSAKAVAAKRNKAIADAVLKMAYEVCSVAILIDRGFGVALGNSNVISASEDELSQPPQPLLPTAEAQPVVSVTETPTTTTDTEHTAAVKSGSLKPKVRRAVVLVFYGGPDDREAAAVVLRLSMDPNTVVNVFRIKHGSKKVATKQPTGGASESNGGDLAQPQAQPPTTQPSSKQPASDADDAVISILESRPSITIEEISDASAAVSRVAQLGGRDLLILGRNIPSSGALSLVSRPTSTSSLASKSFSWLKRAGSDGIAPAPTTGGVSTSYVLGEMADRLLSGSVQIGPDVVIKASVLVVQGRKAGVVGGGVGVGVGASSSSSFSAV